MKIVEMLENWQEKKLRAEKFFKIDGKKIKMAEMLGKSCNSENCREDFIKISLKLVGKKKSKW